MTVECFGQLEVTTFRHLWGLRADQKTNATVELPCLLLIRSLASVQGLEHPCCTQGQ